MRTDGLQFVVELIQQTTRSSSEPSLVVVEVDLLLSYYAGTQKRNASTALPTPRLYE